MTLPLPPPCHVVMERGRRRSCSMMRKLSQSYREIHHTHVSVCTHSACVSVICVHCALYMYVCTQQNNIYSFQFVCILIYIHSKLYSRVYR